VVRYPTDSEGYRACSVCSQSVNEPPGQSWVQFNDVVITNGRQRMRREWAANECDDDPMYADRSGPVLHLGPCALTYLESMSCEIAPLIARNG
jgi:hypothetical protein